MQNCLCFNHVYWLSFLLLLCAFFFPSASSASPSSPSSSSFSSSSCSSLFIFPSCFSFLLCSALSYFAICVASLNLRSLPLSLNFLLIFANYSFPLLSFSHFLTLLISFFCSLNFPLNFFYNFSRLRCSFSLLKIFKAD